jgi:hypothetical protein
LLQVEFVFDRLLADLAMLDLVPDLFVGIEFGGMGQGNRIKISL